MGVNRALTSSLAQQHDADATLNKAEDKIVIEKKSTNADVILQKAGGVNRLYEDDVRLQGLRLDLGLPRWLARQLVCRGSYFRKLMDTLATGPLSRHILKIVFFVLRVLPYSVKNFFFIAGFKMLMFVFRLLPKRLSHVGLHDSLSLEVHALTFLYWFARLVPVTFPMARGALSEMGSAYPPSRALMERVDKPEFKCSGIWLRTAPAHVEDPPVLFWCFGGCFIGGSAPSNAGLAEQYGRKLGVDVFIPDYRLYPEVTIEECYMDCCRAYEWLVSWKSPKKVCLFGISAGGGIAIRLAQLIAQQDTIGKKYFLGKAKLSQPAGCAAYGPFVDFNIGHFGDAGEIFSACDWIVTQRVLELVVPAGPDLAGSAEKVRNHSPLYQPVKANEGLCPVCVSTSDHEVCSDSCFAMVDKLKAAGNDVQLFSRPYLPHAYQLFSAFIPEAKLAEAELLNWLQQRFDAGQETEIAAPAGFESAEAKRVVASSNAL